MTSANGILLFREVSKVLVTYGSRILPLAHHADIYAFKYKGIWISLTIFSRGTQYSSCIVGFARYIYICNDKGYVMWYILLNGKRFSYPLSWCLYQDIIENWFEMDAKYVVFFNSFFYVGLLIMVLWDSPGWSIDLYYLDKPELCFV